MGSDWNQRRKEFLLQIAQAEEDLIFLDLEAEMAECWGSDEQTQSAARDKVESCRAAIHDLSIAVRALDRLNTQC